MADDLAVDFAAIDAIRRRLADAAEAVGTTASSAPGTVGDGLGGASAARILDNAMMSAGNLCAALEVLDARLGEAAATFAADDAAQGEALGRMTAR